jgi:hypothetical protein
MVREILLDVRSQQWMVELYPLVDDADDHSGTAPRPDPRAFDPQAFERGAEAAG